MLLTIDVGNTTIKLALFEENEQIAFDMLVSKMIDFKSFILSFLYKSNIRETQLEDCILSSVVPQLTGPIISAIQEITNKDPIVIDFDHHYGIDVDESITDKVGSDLLVMSAYAYQTYKNEIILVSLGTATVVAHITGDGVFKGCLIAPGFNAMSSAIFSKAAQLPEFTPEKHNGYICTNTLDAMNVGVYDGFIGMVEHFIDSVKNEIGGNPIIIASGGCGKDVVPYIASITNYNPDLVTLGLNYIYQRYIK